MMAGFGGIGIVFMLFFWGILILGGVWLVKVLVVGVQGQSGTLPHKQSSALEILDQRYARGEISSEEPKNSIRKKRV